MDNNPQPEQQAESTDYSIFSNRLLDIFFSPRAVFSALRAKPDIWFPIIMVLIMGVGGLISGQSVNDYFARASGEEVDAVPKAFVLAMGFVFIMSFVIAGWFVRVLLFSVWAQLWDGQSPGFKARMSIFGYSMVPVTIGSIFQVVLLYLNRGTVTPVGLDIFLAPELRLTTALGTLLASFNPFNVGYLLLNYFAISESFLLDSRRAWIINLIAWLVEIAFTVGVTVLSNSIAANLK